MDRKSRKITGIILLICCDILILLGTLYLSVILRIKLFPLFLKGLPVFDQDIIRYFPFIFLWSAVLFYKGAYIKRFTFWDEIRILWESTLISLTLIFFILFVSKKSHEFSRIVIISWAALSALLLPVLRTKLKLLLYKIGLLRGRLLIVGANDRGISFLRMINEEPNLGYEVIGFLDEDFKEKRIEGIKVYKYTHNIEKYIRTAFIDTVVIAKDYPQEELSNLINRIHRLLENVIYVPSINGIPLIMEPRYFLREEIFCLEIKNNLDFPLNYLIKRVFDYILSIIIFFLVTPIMILIAIAIKINSKGPIIFYQERVGKNGRIFRCYKFRTMYEDAEERLKRLLDTDPKAKKEWEEKYKLKDDPRITLVGKFLRRTSLDELPQIINVLKGEMSIVGPRPVTKQELDRYYKELSAYYLRIPPGITGLWQVSGRNNLTYKERVALDVWYVRNWSLWLDIVILIKTIKVIFTGEGAY